jgi:hypothetical protein
VIGPDCLDPTEPSLGKSGQMSHTFVGPETLVHTPQVPIYPEDLLPQLQYVLAALADLEVQYELARELLDEWSGPEMVKAQLFAGLEQHHRAQREPYARRLAELKQQLAALPLCGVRRVVH